MKRRSTLAIVLALFLVAATPITVDEGETVVLTANTGSTQSTDAIAAEFSIPRTDINHYITQNNPTSPIIRQPVTFDLEPGDYEMTIRTWVNDRVTNYDTLDVTVRDRTPQREETTAAPRGPQARIHIEPIPDTMAGSTFIMPVRISGNGEFMIEIPRLTFAIYEVPGPVYVNGTSVVPVLLHIDEDAEPGTYTIPVRVGDEQTSARLRIIRYQDNESNLWWILIPVGIIILIAGVLLLLSRNRHERGPGRTHEPTEPADDKELISYY